MRGSLSFSPLPTSPSGACAAATAVGIVLWNSRSIGSRSFGIAIVVGPGRRSLAIGSRPTGFSHRRPSTGTEAPARALPSHRVPWAVHLLIPALGNRASRVIACTRKDRPCRSTELHNFGDFMCPGKRSNLGGLVVKHLPPRTRTKRRLHE